MIRIVAIIVSVGFLMATGVAGAAPTDQVRLPVSVPSPAPQETEASSVVVAKGDHLWKISVRHLGKDGSEDQVAPYWRQVVDVNTPHLKSGDPDLIYPGEVVELPAIREQQ
jgi:nucleoid-associated protein YgaU